MSLTGRCLCGDITYSVTAKARGPSVCHCGQCRRQSGHLWASAHVPEAGVAIAGPVRWSAATEAARPGFCPRCGSVLYWKHQDEDTLSFSLGSLDAPTGLRLGRDIFAAVKRDYNDLPDDRLPRDP